MEQTIQEQKEKQLARIKSPEEQRKAKMMEQNREQLAEFFKTDFSKGFKDKTEAALAREKEKANIRKENVETLKDVILGPKGKELFD
jgi:predicted nucleic acid-binding protein